MVRIKNHYDKFNNIPYSHSRPQRPQSFWSATGRLKHRKTTLHELIVKSGKPEWLKWSPTPVPPLLFSLELKKNYNNNLNGLKLQFLPPKDRI